MFVTSSGFFRLQASEWIWPKFVIEIYSELTHRLRFISIVLIGLIKTNNQFVEQNFVSVMRVSVQYGQYWGKV